MKNKKAFGAAVLFAVLLSGCRTARFTEIDVERINIIGSDGRRQMVLSNRALFPNIIMNGKELDDQRNKSGMIFYNEVGDECGGLVFKGKLDENGKPDSGMHLSMDRFGGDQQLVLSHTESGGGMNTALVVYDRGLNADYGPFYEAMEKAPKGPEKEALKAKWEAAGGKQTSRVFVGKTKGKASAIILSDEKGRPRIRMTVSPQGEPCLQFVDENGKVMQTLPEKAASEK